MASAGVTCHANSLWQGCSSSQGYDLRLNRTKEPVHEKEKQRPPEGILAELSQKEQEILLGIEELEGMLR